MNATYLSMVADFHRVMRYRQPEPIAPDLSDPATNALRPKLILEELRELKTALDDMNRAEQLDALADTQYVLSGAILAWGMWENSRIKIDLKRIRNMGNHIGAMIGLTGQLEVASELGYDMQTFTFIQLLQNRLTQAVHGFGFDGVFYEAFCEVHANNMDKFWTASERSTAPALTYENTSMGIIGRHPGGKIAKPPHHSKVDLSRFIK